MIYIFEGCDCVGKTTLINNFLKYSGKSFSEKTVVKHFTNPPLCKNQRRYVEFEYNTEIYRLMSFNKDLNFIYDRFYLGELVYGPLYRKYKPIYVKNIELQLNQLNAILIYVYADIKDIEKRFDGKYINKKDIGKIINRYKKVLENSDIENIIYINTSELNEIQSYKYLINSLYGLSQRGKK